MVKILESALKIYLFIYSISRGPYTSRIQGLFNHVFKGFLIIPLSWPKLSLLVRIESIYKFF
jgi:hypothetical protein